VDHDHFDPQLLLFCQLLTLGVVAVYCFVSCLPEYKKKFLQNTSEGAKRPSGASVGASPDLAMPDVIILFDTPFGCQVPIKQVTPADDLLFRN
jgi:hypothetical protein